MAEVRPIPDNYPVVCPYLHIDGVTTAIGFYTHVFGATVRLLIDGLGGKVGHAELEIGDSLVMLADEHADIGIRGPKAFGGSPVTLSIYVEDVDAVVAIAIEAGATLTRPIENRFYGDRVGQFEDPFGHVWSVQTHVEDVSPEDMKQRAAAGANGG